MTDTRTRSASRTQSSVLFRDRSRTARNRAISSSENRWPSTRVKTSGVVVPPAGNPAPASVPAASTAEAKPAAPGAVADTQANRAKLCDQLRKNVDTLGKEKNVSVDDGKGGTRPLDDAGRKREVETTQAQMTIYCK